MFLNIITPCTRLDNLRKIAESINIPRQSYRWLVVCDMERLPEVTRLPEIAEAYAVKLRSSVSGNAQRNYALRLVKEGHIYFNDDDTTIHPKLWENVSSLTQDFISFQQVDKSGRLRLKGDVIKPGSIDSHNFIVSKKCVGNLQWDVPVYAADGFFATKCYRQATTKVYLPITLSIYNALRS